MALNKILLFSFLTIFTSCNGQEKTNTQTDNQPAGLPKLVKTQGSKEGDNIHCSLQDKVGECCASF